MVSEMQRVGIYLYKYDVFKVKVFLQFSLVCCMNHSDICDIYHTTVPVTKSNT